MQCTGIAVEAFTLLHKILQIDFKAFDNIMQLEFEKNYLLRRQNITCHEQNYIVVGAGAVYYA